MLPNSITYSLVLQNHLFPTSFNCLLANFLLKRDTLAAPSLAKFNTYGIKMRKQINCCMRWLLQETVVSNFINYACIICIIYNYYTRLYTTRHARFLQYRTSKNKNLNNVIKFDMDTRVIWIISWEKLCCR